MKTDRYSNVILDEQEIFAGLYSGKLTSLAIVNSLDSETIERFNKSIDTNADHIDKLQNFTEMDCSIEEYDRIHQGIWPITTDFCLNLEEFLYSACTTVEQKNRVELELKLFSQHNMFDILLVLKYLIDYMRKHNIVWGLGRGSSVSSYCLYLIGVHKVDSIKYQLDITEFLKGE